MFFLISQWIVLFLLTKLPDIVIQTLSNILFHPRNILFSISIDSSLIVNINDLFLDYWINALLPPIVFMAVKPGYK